jgi:ribosome-associated translation inhibitor RaiA
MRTPLQVTFRHMPSSEAVTTEIHQQLEHLDRIYDRSTSCHVLVETPHCHQHQGRIYRIGIELGIPGEDIVISHTSGEDGAHEDVYVAVRDAFRAARRRLESHISRIREQNKRSAVIPS